MKNTIHICEDGSEIQTNTFFLYKGLTPKEVWTDGFSANLKRKYGPHIINNKGQEHNIEHHAWCFR
jgi:hypothetical protein